MFICVNQWLILFLTTDCDSSGAAINADYTDFINLITSMFGADLPQLTRACTKKQIDLVKKKAKAAQPEFLDSAL